MTLQMEEWGLRSESGRRQLSCILELHGALSASHCTHLCQLSSLCGMPLHLVHPSLASAQGWAPAAPALLPWDPTFIAKLAPWYTLPYACLSFHNGKTPEEGEGSPSAASKEAPVGTCGRTMPPTDSLC